MKNWLIFFMLVQVRLVCAQRTVSITIDDVPNVHLFAAEGYKSKLLERLDSIRVPVAIFINEQNLRQTQTFDKNKELLRTWLLKDFVTPGNHSYSHPNYGEVGFEKFSGEVVKGEELTLEILKGSGKKLRYFRFPFNAMGKDSMQHAQMRTFLQRKNYIPTPFTVENEDWLYAQVYEAALAKNDKRAAAEIGREYVQETLKRFDFFDSLAIAEYQRPVSQIYLCHDNLLNTDFLPELIQRLKEKRYQMISLDAAIADPVYRSAEHYYGNGGFSWFYRWMQDKSRRQAAMRREPENPRIHKALEEIKKK